MLLQPHGRIGVAPVGGPSGSGKSSARKNWEGELTNKVAECNVILNLPIVCGVRNRALYLVNHIHPARKKKN